MKIGVFDSGMGGLSVANAIKSAMPGHQIHFVNDSKNVPYGNKTPDVLLQLVTPILEHMVESGCQVIVIACNTVSTTLIDALRGRLPVPLIAMEPMVKPAAAQTKTACIAVCATPTTLASPRYNWLKEQYAQGITVLEPDCSDWSYMIENRNVDHAKIRQRIEEVCKQGADTIVLGCTHYHWIEQDIQKVADEYGARVLQPEQSIVAQLRRVIAQLA